MGTTTKPNPEPAATRLRAFQLVLAAEFANACHRWTFANATDLRRKEALK